MITGYEEIEGHHNEENKIEAVENILTEKKLVEEEVL